VETEAKMVHKGQILAVIRRASRIHAPILIDFYPGNVPDPPGPSGVAAHNSRPSGMRRRAGRSPGRSTTRGQPMVSGSREHGTSEGAGGPVGLAVWLVGCFPARIDLRPSLSEGVPERRSPGADRRVAAVLAAVVSWWCPVGWPLGCLGALRWPTWPSRGWLGGPRYRGGARGEGGALAGAWWLGSG
jgi:hypothetical protein